MSSLQEKALDILRVLDMNLGTVERIAAWDEIVARYSAKAVKAKAEELARRGYIEYGASPTAGWLTDKGREALGQ